MKRQRALFVLCAALMPQLAAAQQKETIRESDPELRRQALISLWDAAPGSLEPQTGMSYAMWLSVQPGASSAMLRDGVPVPTPGPGHPPRSAAHRHRRYLSGPFAGPPLPRSSGVHAGYQGN